MDIRDALLLIDKSADGKCFYVVCMTGLQGHFYHAVNFVFINQSVKKLQTVRIWCHNGASDVQISPCQRIVYVWIILVHQLVYGLSAGAVLEGYDDTAVVLNSINHLFRGAADRTTGNQDAGVILFHLSRRILLLNLGSQGIYLIWNL